MTPTKLQTAVFGGGCFWCTEAVFKMLRGVASVEPGYSGGATPNPTYDQVCSGTSCHVECAKIEYDPALIKYTDLLTVFFGSHDPTTPDRQGNDVGSQYRSVIFYSTPTQKAEAERFIAGLNTSNEKGAPIVTTVEPLGPFYVAEDYHRDYYAAHPNQTYCLLVINPKLDKVARDFAALIKDPTKQK
jgi:peptide-methionine (S)-S-oxide reductase